MKNDDKPGFKRAQRFVKRDAHQYNAQREHQKRLKAKRLDVAKRVISEFLCAFESSNPQNLNELYMKVALAVVHARNVGFDTLKEKDNG